MRIANTEHRLPDSSKYCWLFLVLTLMPAFCSPVSAAGSEPGINLEVLQQLDSEFAAGRHGYIDGLLILQHDKVLVNKRYEHDYIAPFDAYMSGPEQVSFGGRGAYGYLDPDWHPWLNGGDLHTLQSVTKSVTSALIGIAIGRGEIESVDIKVAPLLGQEAPFGGDPRAGELTLWHFLTMTSGIEWNEENYEDADNDGNLIEATDEWVQYVLNKPFSHNPGEVFNYNSGTAQLLDQVLYQSTGIHAEEYARIHLFAPLEIEAYYWKTTPDGFSDTLGGLYLSPADLAKFGKLYADDGVWAGQRILPEGWVQASWKPAVSVGSIPGRMYGYQWWLVPDPDQPARYIPVAVGYGGQKLAIFPEEDVIAVLFGWNIMEGTTTYPTDEFVRQMARAVR